MDLSWESSTGSCPVKALPVRVELVVLMMSVLPVPALWLMSLKSAVCYRVADAVKSFTCCSVELFRVFFGSAKEFLQSFFFSYRAVLIRKPVLRCICVVAALLADGLTLPPLVISATLPFRPPRCTPAAVLGSQSVPVHASLCESSFMTLCRLSRGSMLCRWHTMLWEQFRHVFLMSCSVLLT